MQSSHDSKTEFEQQVGSAYTRDFLPAVIGYVVVTLLVSFFVDFDDPAWWKYALAVTPLVPALWGVRAIRRHLGRIDEMQQNIQLKALATGFAVSMVVSLTVGFLALADLDINSWGPWIIYSAGMAGWAVTAARGGAIV